MKNKIIISIALLFLLTTCFSQIKYQPRQISFKVRRLANKLQKYNEVTGPRIGKAARKSDQYIIFEKLKLKANENDLYELTNHRSPIVRAYAFTGLIDIKSPKTLDVITKNQKDTIVIHQQFGCLGSRNTVIGYMLTFAAKYIKDNQISLTATQSELFEKLSDEYLDWEDRQRRNPTLDTDN